MLLNCVDNPLGRILQVVGAHGQYIWHCWRERVCVRYDKTKGREALFVGCFVEFGESVKSWNSMDFRG